MLGFRRSSGEATQEVFSSVPMLFPPQLLASRSMLLEVIYLHQNSVQGPYKESTSSSPAFSIPMDAVFSHRAQSLGKEDLF